MAQINHKKIRRKIKMGGDSIILASLCYKKRLFFFLGHNTVNGANQ